MGIRGRIWLAAVALSLGVVAGSHGFGGGIFVAALGLGCLPLRRRTALRAGAIVVLSFGAGATSASVRAMGDGVLGEMATTVPRCRMVGTVLEEAGGLGTLASVARAECAAYAPLAEVGLVFLDDLDADAGSPFRATGRLVPLGSDPFERARARVGAQASLRIDTGEVGPPTSPAHRVAASIRAGLRASTKAMSHDRGGLLTGLTIGDTDRIAPATMEALRRAGLTHLVAVSGSNVAIVVGSMLMVAARIRVRARIGLGAAALGLFVLVVGPDASVLRAAVMGGIALAALAWGRRSEPLSSLGLAVLVLVAARPPMAFSVGLHLSVAATAGIVLWSGPLARRMSALPRPVALGASVTLAAQAAVAPILIATFGDLSLVGPVANVLALPAVPPATILGFVSALLSPLSTALGELPARAAEPLVAWILWIGRTLGGASWAAVELPGAAAIPAAVPVIAWAWIALRDGPR